MQIVQIDTKEIVDEESFHEVFKKTFGFPDFYGRNMDAWIDCMSSLDDPESKMSTVTVEKGEVLTLDLGILGTFSERCPEQYAALVECLAFVNYRRIEKGEYSILALSFYS